MLLITKNNHPIDMETRSLISTRYKTITKAVNGDFWNSNSDTDHSFYVGSYGRGTAINASDLDVLIELPNDEYEHFTSLQGNGQSRLLQAVRRAILDTYPRTDVRGDGQVVVVNFSDGMKFEILPAFKKLSVWGFGDGTYIYPDSNMGGNWLSTNPKAEQLAMAQKNGLFESNGLLYDACKHIRHVRSIFYPNSHLSGILIDSFVYSAIRNWHWKRDYEGDIFNYISFEQSLLDFYNSTYRDLIYAPGSHMKVDTTKDWELLGNVLNIIA